MNGWRADYKNELEIVQVYAAEQEMGALMDRQTDYVKLFSLSKIIIALAQKLDTIVY